MMAEYGAVDHHEKLAEYYSQYNISLDAVIKGSASPSTMMHRFIRLHPAFDSKETLHLIKKDLGLEDYPIPVPWLDPSFGFFAIPANVSLHASEAYKEGRVYGQDVSSGAAVAALLSDYHHVKRLSASKADPIERVLDLCCAPGLKLCAIADWLRKNKGVNDAEGGESLVVGVDSSVHRLSVCRNIVQKHQIEPFALDSSPDFVSPDTPRIRLYHGDGTKLGTEAPDLVFDSEIAGRQRQRLGKRIRLNKSARAREKRLLKEIAEEQDATDSVFENASYDRVLVDAECTTDGSIKHVKKQIGEHEKKDLTTQALFAIPSLTNDQELLRIVDLQCRLAETGFRLLRKGGCMVYSTCSLSIEQNEGVVRKLLDKHKDEASVIPLKFLKSVSTERSSLVREGKIPGTVRFLPFHGSKEASKSDNLHGEGFFVAKIKRV